ncbi:MAG: transposase [Bacteroidota bacterium]
MKANSKTSTKVIKVNIEEKLQRINLHKIALSVGLIKHIHQKKVSPSHLMTGFFLMAFKRTKYILQIAKKGDLVIRDLGYFVLNVFKEMAQTGIFFLSRLKYGVTIIDSVTGQPINLLEALKNKQSIDMQVYIGAKEKIAIRLVVVRVPEEVAAERRRQLKKDRDKRKKPSKEYLALLDWTLFITSVPKEIWTIDQIVKVYRLRWRIEMIFKSWKSYFNMASLVANRCTNKIRVEALIYSMLIFITMFNIRLYKYFLDKLYYSKGIAVSLMKFSKYISENLDMILKTPDIDLIEEQVAYYCQYDRRHDRSNYWQLLHQI